MRWSTSLPGPSACSRRFRLLGAASRRARCRPTVTRCFRGGALLQWGTGNAGPGGPSITFPVAFPVACLSVTAGTANGASYGGYISVDNNLVTRTGFVAYASGGAVTSNFFAIGY
ncbi:gp53-like domain-containing protein [Azospirillum brasilense]|uniref:gp53-like domain-containing protein n=1 Tax=Azospirillum brasilense TaxID=192 RepID=UPI003F675C15